MARKSIVLLLFISAVVCGNTYANNDKKNIWAKYQPIVIDTVVIVPTDYEKAIFDFMNEWYIKKTESSKCKRDSLKPVFYDDKTYIDRLQKLPYRIEMPYNNVVRLFINKYAERIRQVEYMTGLGERYYFSIFEHALAKYDLPLELRFLPIIESALNPKAISSAGAGGLWQFMIGTGKMYDLEINSLVDDRFDPRKSSDAAARYLRDLYTIYNDWHLVIAAYNCGPGNVARAIRKSGGKTGYWDIYPYLPKETRGYVPIFIAANYIMNYYNKHNVCPAIPAFIQATDTVVINKRLHLMQVANILNIPIEELRFYNPQYKRDIIPGDIKPYSIVLPMNKVQAFSNNIDTIFAHNADNLTKKQVIAEPATVKHDSIQSHNKNKSKSRKNKSSATTSYKVRKGENLSTIAHKNNTTVAKIKKANGLSSDNIREGQRLKIPK